MAKYRKTRSSGRGEGEEWRGERMDSSPRKVSSKITLPTIVKAEMNERWPDEPRAARNPLLKSREEDESIVRYRGCDEGGKVRAW